MLGFMDYTVGFTHEIFFSLADSIYNIGIYQKKAMLVVLLKTNKNVWLYSYTMNRQNSGFQPILDHVPYMYF